MAATASGLRAETAVVEHLTAAGFKILDRNWKTHLCEIDIIAQKDKVVYFVEVKYRERPDQGSGLEYIVPRKLKQVEFAAKLWVHEHSWEGDWRLMAAAVSGADRGSIELIEII